MDPIEDDVNSMSKRSFFLYLVKYLFSSIFTNTFNGTDDVEVLKIKGIFLTIWRSISAAMAIIIVVLWLKTF